MTRTFYGEDIVTLLGLDPNLRAMPLRDLCAVLGLEVAAQERRIKRHAVLGEGLQRLLMETEEGLERLPCLRIDLVPLWLMTLEVSAVAPVARARLELLQREAASVVWQSFRPQGFGPEDALLPNRHEQNAAELAYASELAVANLARQQLLIERQIDNLEEDWRPDTNGARQLDDPQAETLARAVRRVAQAAAERTRRNEYGGVYSGLYRQFGIGSYRRTPIGRLREALEWLERWRGDIMGEPEPPPDIE